MMFHLNVRNDNGDV